MNFVVAARWDGPKQSNGEEALKIRVSTAEPTLLKANSPPADFWKRPTSSFVVTPQGLTTAMPSIVPSLASIDALVVTAGNNAVALVTALQQALTRCLQGNSGEPSLRIAAAQKIMAIAMSGKCSPTTELLNSYLLVMEKYAASHERLSGSDGIVHCGCHGHEF